MTQTYPIPFDILDFILDLTEDSEVRELLTVCLGRVLANMEGRGENWRDAVERDTVRHIVDWLAAAHQQKAAWLARKDSDGRPKKLMKFSTVASIVAEADKAMLLFAQKFGNVKLAEGEEELWLTLEGGYSLVRMLTPGALDRESSTMQHCIGNGGYDRYLETGERMFLSLRDSYGKPHATMEVDIAHGRVMQLQGKQNAIPARRYVEAMRSVFLRPDFNPSHVLARLGLVLAGTGEFIDKLSIPVDTVVLGDLIYDRNAGKEPLSLPDGLTVRGDLTIVGCGLTNLPRRLTVEGKLVLASLPGLTELPSDIDLRDDVQLTVDDLALLPDGFTVGGDLFVSSPGLRKLPRGLHVGKNLSVHGGSLSVVPSDMKVKGKAEFKKCEIGAFEDGFSASGTLIVEACEVGSLPEGFSVPGDLNLSLSKVATLPETAEIGGSLFLTFARVDRVPAGWNIGGSIEAGGSTVTSLVGRTTVRGHLNIADTPVTDLSSLRSVWGSLSVFNTKVPTLPAGLVIKGDLDAKGAELSVLPDDISVGGRLVLASSKVSVIPAGIRVGGSCDFAFTPISELPVGFLCSGYLDIIGTQVRAIPDDCVIKQLMCDDKLEHIGDGVVVVNGIITPEISDIVSVEGMKSRIAARHRAAA